MKEGSGGGCAICKVFFYRLFVSSFYKRARNERKSPFSSLFTLFHRRIPPIPVVSSTALSKRAKSNLFSQSTLKPFLMAGFPVALLLYTYLLLYCYSNRMNGALVLSINRHIPWTTCHLPLGYTFLESDFPFFFFTFSSLSSFVLAAGVFAFFPPLPISCYIDSSCLILPYSTVHYHRYLTSSDWFDCFGLLTDALGGFEKKKLFLFSFRFPCMYVFFLLSNWVWGVRYVILDISALDFFRSFPLNLYKS